MAKKTRYPQKLNWQDYATFMSVELLPWLTLQVGQPDYMGSLVTGLEAKVNAYLDALALFIEKDTLAPERRKLLSEKFKALREALIQIKMTLPVFFNDPSILGEFGLSVNITNDEDDMFVVAKNCLAHWDLVKLLPEYAELVPDFTALQALFDDYNATRALYTLTFQEAQIAQNDMVTTREVCHEHERKIFFWYRSRYRDPKDEWWTESPWGRTSSSSSSEPPAPVWPDWPGPVEASAVQIGEGLVRITFSGLNGGKTLRIERLKQGDADYVLVTQGLPLDDPEEVMPFDDDHLDKKKYTYKLTPFDEGGNPGTSALVGVTVS